MKKIRVKNLVLSKPFLKNIFLSFICLPVIALSQVAMASSDFIRGEGHFISRENDSLSFVKEQLLASAMRDVITKELAELGLSPDLFWQEFDAKFKKSFESKLIELREKHGIKEDEDIANLDREAYEAFNEELRVERLKARSNFASLNSVIPSYSIQRMSRSTRMPNSRHLLLHARVDRESLTSIYYDFTQEAESRHFSRLYVTTEFQLSEMNWSEAGVQYGQDFIEVVNEHWMRWLGDNFNAHVDEVILTDSSVEERLLSFLSSSQRRESGIDPILRSHRMSFYDQPEDYAAATQEESIMGASAETSLSGEQDTMANSLWLRIVVKMSKSNENPSLELREFEIDGEFVLVELKTNELLKSHDLNREVREFSTSDDHRLSSDLASLVYRLPIVSLDRFARRFNESIGNRRSFAIKVSQVNNIQELMQVTRVIRERGISSRVEPVIESYDGEVGKILISYQGAPEDILRVLLSLNATTIRETRHLIIPDPSRPDIFSLAGGDGGSQTEDLELRYQM